MKKLQRYIIVTMAVLALIVGFNLVNRLDDVELEEWSEPIFSMEEWKKGRELYEQQIEEKQKAVEQKRKLRLYQIPSESDVILYNPGYYFLDNSDRRRIREDWRYFIELKKSLTGIDLSDIVLPDKAFAALTKSVAAVDEWASVAQNAILEGATTDISTAYDIILHIDMALSSATAQTNGAKVEVQISSATSGDEDWSTFASFIGPTGTANSEAVSGTEAAGSTVIECASTLGLYDDDETRFIFFLNGTVANSELGLLVSHVANTSVTVQDGITNAQTSSTMYDIAKRYVVQLPFSANRVRVIYDNTRDATGSTVHTYCRLSRVTAL